MSTDAYRLVAGDVVATRQNDRELRTDRGLMVKNRDQWEVLGVHGNGALSVSGPTGAVRLPTEYVAEHVDLAYAQTSHANQGRTVDRSFLLLDGPADTRGVYVPMTRGRHGNDAFVVIEGEQTAPDVLAQALARDWIDQPAVARRAELAERAESGRGRETNTPLPSAELRELLERDHAISDTLSTAEFRVEMYGDQLARATKRQDELAKQLAETEARHRTAQEVIDEYDHPLRRRLHRDELRAAYVTTRQAGFAIEGQSRELAEIEKKLPGLQSSVAAAQETLGGRPTLDRDRHDIKRQLGRDLDARKDHLVFDPPDYIIDTLGPRPVSGTARLWDEAAARIDQHRAAFDLADEGPILGSRHPAWEQSPFATSQREAASAVDGLNRTLGRGREIEPPSLELGIGL